MELSRQIDRAAPGIALDLLDDRPAVGAADRQRIGIDDQSVEPPERAGVGRHAAPQAVDGGLAVPKLD
jgi:hypothetical protein